jgi:hypothetical protein
MELGSSIYAKVSATNYYGTSEMSDAFNGGTMVVMPDAPLNVRDDTSITTASVIGLTWAPEARRLQEASNGGTPILDYAISYDQATGTWIDLVTGITDDFYTTTISLTAGGTYSFKIRARNAVGFSEDSDPISIIAAEPPAQASAPTLARI